LWAIVGLGNPGRKYSRTRHNIGFAVVEEIASQGGVALREKPLYLIGKCSIGETASVLVEPLTFMNRSGEAVGEVLGESGVPPGNLVVIHDDIDMETGRLKIKRGGGSGGHRGIESIIREIGTREFTRVKLGIGRDEDVPPEDYVLSKFRRGELPAVREAIITAAEAVSTIVKDGVEHAMNIYNEKP
jgi:PTH1 family peptidyl-tRNA hydrolase